MKFRGLRTDEIDVRVGSISAKGVSLLLYKDARCDMNILDEVFGVMGWQREHKVVNGNLYCGIGIWNKDIQQWVWKWDCGIESRADGDGNEKKGEASDAFKRAGFNVGIGRELYTAGFIFVACETQKKQNGKGYELVNPYQFNGAYVSHVEYKETEHKREIVGLIIKDSKGTQLFVKRGQAVESGEVTKPKNQSKTQKTEQPTKEELAKAEELKSKKIDKIKIATLESEIARTGSNKANMLKQCGVSAIEDITVVQYDRLMKIFQNAKDKPKIDLGL